MPQLFEHYQTNVAPKLSSEFGVKNPMASPKVTKITLNMGIGEIKENKDEQEKSVTELASIAGQRPSIRKSRKSIAGFNVREGQPVGVAVTLRGKRMYTFLDKLLNVVLPRLRDFRGVSRKSFDQQGNYTLGFSEHTVFPEIDLGKITRTKGLEITISINTKDPQKSERLLEELGMPFEKKKM
ncbi:MAG: 50S ribosomal protein L5 [Candidatus Blackburnbacteria bacterium RIFCSPHIGHO2_01_FULL_44_64]|uniref:Large ribosomal subunit protein uL5 n=1 Tax=Candidatus Blackburnbacteria bacterium RIFCSPHIGHO2_02_FULL_44_20 TaxID=1797516 RepID=A0A1G1VAY2_9BACT|nr:MAG: 50S ribosomal protein L5 [Candidatus Blackburnbacteria bacterium RIFCSPHIGHO2_01_FULL_44_64]OGY11823.1 MAG: 50S ribosomal protein L5 [Candidatus Blackburnbacteria bacterium RIFCSPHIGHO2_12_FULL_44_25]OGY12372.1 MAG: 50S ribosomal protein L5 [Candidatus Blackburnbacteria bacterium RIFCSPHIGHO2_02_FULL_44_20]OGY15077.1 MAG: 50S ribosomal protein L5 [Candidatus Blackburnbacteria bacterium RIFCSPLOWO2_01_FULL_44_43]OGY16016.1 MAG: 50S ribosomal protein L5 [Candidatus Blackburnbacteria bacte